MTTTTPDTQQITCPTCGEALGLVARPFFPESQCLTVVMTFEGDVLGIQTVHETLRALERSLVANARAEGSVLSVFVRALTQEPHRLIAELFLSAKPITASRRTR